jgi:hypothetical protein
MKIINYRKRFANNSSSSHSVVFLKGILAADEEAIPYPVKGSYPAAEDSYGWSNFELHTPLEKLQYLASQMYSRISSFTNTFDLPALVTLDKTGIDVRKGEHGVDHQSMWSIPLAHPHNPLGEWWGHERRQAFSEPFIAAMFRNVVNNRDCVVFGGNDNDEDFGEEGKAQLAMPSFGQWFCREERQDVFTLFHELTGDRMTLDLAPWLEKEPLPKLRSPLLVDLKITDYCSHGCKFCYQGSTKEGKHASLERINTLLQHLAAMEVFEVAIGGGEPTQHPDFLEILQNAYDVGLQPNFTTFDVSWVESNVLLAKKVKEVRSSFAVSNPNLATAAKLIILKQEGYNVAAQFIWGLMRLEDVERIKDLLIDSGVPITFLGYKDTGRGSAFRNEKYSAFKKWEEKVALEALGIGHWNSPAVDTSFLRNLSPETLASLDQRTLEAREGYQSWYIDAVTLQHAPSSYEPDSLLPLVEVKEKGRWGRELAGFDLLASWNQCKVSGG